MTNYPKGSAGAAEAKAFKIFMIIAGIIGVLLLCVMFVFPTEYRAHVRATAGFLNVLGAFMLVAGFACLYGAYKAGEGGSYGWTAAWLALSAGGFLVAACQDL